MFPVCSAARGKTRTSGACRGFQVQRAPPSDVRQVTPPKTSQPWLASLKSSSGVYPAPGGATSVVLECRQLCPPSVVRDSARMLRPEPPRSSRPQAKPVPWPSSCTLFAFGEAGSSRSGPPSATATCWAKAAVSTTSQPDQPTPGTRPPAGVKLAVPVRLSPPSGSRLPRLQLEPQSAVVHTRIGGVPPLPGSQGMAAATVSSRPWPEAENHGPKISVFPPGSAPAACQVRPPARPR